MGDVLEKGPDWYWEKSAKDKQAAYANTTLGEEGSRRRQIVDIANQLAAQSAKSVAGLRSAFDTQRQMLSDSEMKGRQAIAKQAAQGLAAGASGGLRANAAMANDAAMQAAGARAGFESQMGQLRADQAVQQAQALGQAEMDPLRQQMIAVEKAQEMQASEAGDKQRYEEKQNALINQFGQGFGPMETDESYARKLTAIAVQRGDIPNTPEARNRYFNEVMVKKSGNPFF